MLLLLDILLVLFPVFCYCTLGFISIFFAICICENNCACVLMYITLFLWDCASWTLACLRMIWFLLKHRSWDPTLKVWDPTLESQKVLMEICIPACSQVILVLLTWGTSIWGTSALECILRCGIARLRVLVFLNTYFWWIWHLFSHADHFSNIPFALKSVFFNITAVILALGELIYLFKKSFYFQAFCKLQFQICVL